ncbi:MAG: alpha-amylase family glycosyl hydrolase [Chloroflexota bacterium]
MWMYRGVIAVVLIFSALMSGHRGSALIVHASVASPNSVTVAGDFQHLTACGGDWQPNCAATHMSKSATDGVWRLALTLPAGSYNYKAVIDDDWGNGNFGLHATSGGANIALHVPANGTTVTFYYDPVSHWITDNINSLIVTAAGSFQKEIGCPGDWQPDCLKSWMEDIQGTGTYTFTTPVGMQQTDGDTPVTHFEFKAATGESWNNPNYGVGGGSNNVPFDITSPRQYAGLSFNSGTHVPTATVKSTLPGHDNNVEYDGLGHDSRNSLYRVPFGAVNPNTPVKLRFRTFHNDVTSVTIRLYDTAVGHESREPMTLVARNVDCYDKALNSAGNTCDYWQYTYTPAALGTVYYRFIARDGTATAYYSDTSNRYGGRGVATSDEQDNGFRLNVVDPNFKVIPWMQNGVMYQIFPDRFRNGDTSNDPSPTDPRYDYPAPANATPQQLLAAANAQIQLRPWNALPEGYCRGYVAPSTPCTESAKGRDYFGGDLKGIVDKLGYLKHLGITVLYLNPIFESGSNHGYDTRDYLTINHYFGSKGYFKHLVAEAGREGIKIVLDGVFNHLSSDSPFFDRYHHYTTVGACESADSPYRSWFTFHDVPLGAGPCAGSDASHSATYDGWAGFDSIPVITKKDPANPTQPYAPVANYFYANPTTSVAGFWLNQGISGWRFDVMTDPSFPAGYWQQLRTITKGIQPDSTLIAEAWHWYDNLPLTHGDQADTAMGYRFRNAVLGLLGATDDKGFPQEGDPNLPPSTFANRIQSMREDYADATWYTFQNLLDSHDTKRILWSLTPGKDNRENREFNASNVTTGTSRQRIAALVQMTMPGTPSIYYGDEVGLTGADDPDNRRPFPWKMNADGSYIQDPRDTSYFAAAGNHATFDWYRQLIGVRMANPVLRQGTLTFLKTDDTNKTLAYAMRRDNNLAVVVINRNESASQAIDVPVAGYLRDGVQLTDALGSGSVATAGGKFSVNLNPLGAAIFVMAPGQSIMGPAASTALNATAHNGVTSTVSLSWTGNAAATSYAIYRSPVQGGGYIKIGTSSGTTYSDTAVTNGTTYYYVVRGIDALGNEGESSNEANATPAFPIGYAVLQYPKTISQVITATATTVYGQVYVAGFTDAGGDPAAIQAQVAFGPHSSDPATWDWQPMTYNTGHTGDNNYEYQGSVRADAPGSYDYLVRFSDDGGRTWAYGDRDGYVPPNNPGTDDPGIMTVTPSSDTTAPTTPSTGIDWSAGSLTLTWTASTDPDDAVAEYRIFRGTSPGGEGSVALATVSGSTTRYVDTSVANGQTYYYVVKAYDTSLNASPPSNEVSHRVEAKLVHVTFRVKVPAFTPPGDTVYITGSPDPLCNYCGGSPATAMTETAPGSHTWQITIDIPDGTPIQYKYTRGTYDYVEEWGSITGFTNRVATVHAASPTDLTQVFDDSSDTNADDNHRAVQNWRDALVAGTSASAAGVTVSFNWDVKPAGTDFNNAITVSSGATTMSGTISHNAGAQSLTFTPASALPAGTYTVTVDHVTSLTVQNDGIPIRTPYPCRFTVS